METDSITLGHSRQIVERVAEVTTDLQTQIDNINGVPVVQIARADGGVLYLKETNVNVEHVFVGTTQPTGRWLIWISPQE